MATTAPAAIERTEMYHDLQQPKAEYISPRMRPSSDAVSVDLLRHRIATGELPAVHAGRRLIRVRVDDLRRMFRPLPAARRYRRTA